MSKSVPFHRLRKLVSQAHFARRQGLTDPQQIQAAWQQAALSRRTLLQQGAAAAALLPVVGACKKKGAEDEDIAIIGAGIAGLHCGLRLKEAGLAVTVYEASDRVGGRIFSVSDLFPDGMVVELGGELVDSNHATMWALAEEFGLTLDDRWEDGYLNDVWEVGGVWVSDETLLTQLIDVVDAFQAAYDGAENDDATYEALDNTTLQAWLEENVPGVELRTIIAVAYRGEYGLESDEQSVLNMIYLFGFDSTDEFSIFGDSDERWHIHGGMSVLTEAMAAAIEGQVELDAQLTAVSGNDEDGYTLTFVRADGTTLERTATRVVFSLPFTRLRDVSLDVTLSAEKRALINELGYGTNSKVMGAFHRKVWRDFDAQGGVTSDRPFQQLWDSAIGQGTDDGLLANFLGGDQGVACGEGTAEAWFQGLLPDIDAIFPGASKEYVADSAVRMHWPSAPHQLGSYTCYLPGQWDTYGLEGTSEGYLYFCGEHCSADFQGWMEGAAETGALVAAEIIDGLGLARSRGHDRAVARALRLPQPGYFGRLQPRLRRGARRRLLDTLRLETE